MGNGEWNHDGCNIGSRTSIFWQRSEVTLDAGKFNDPSRTNDWSKGSWKAIVFTHQKTLHGEWNNSENLAFPYNEHPTPLGTSN